MESANTNSTSIGSLNLVQKRTDLIRVLIPVLPDPLRLQPQPVRAIDGLARLARLAAGLLGRRRGSLSILLRSPGDLGGGFFNGTLA